MVEAVVSLGGFAAACPAHGFRGDWVFRPTVLRIPRLQFLTYQRVSRSSRSSCSRPSLVAVGNWEGERGCSSTFTRPRATRGVSVNPEHLLNSVPRVPAGAALRILNLDVTSARHLNAFRSFIFYCSQLLVSELAFEEIEPGTVADIRERTPIPGKAIPVLRASRSIQKLANSVPAPTPASSERACETPPAGESSGGSALFLAAPQRQEASTLAASSSSAMWAFTSSSMRSSKRADFAGREAFGFIVETHFDDAC